MEGPVPVAGFVEAILADGPLAFYRLGGDPSLPAADASGNGHDAVPVGGGLIGAGGLLTWDTDAAYRFPGNGSYLQTSASLDPTAGHAFSCWLVVDALPTSNSFIEALGQQDGSGTGRTWLGLQSDGNAVTFYSLFGAVRQSSSFTPTPGRRHHIGFSVDPTGVYHWVIDGAVTKTGTLVAEFADGPLQIGINKSLSLGSFRGEIDEVAVFDHPLPIERLQTHFRAGAAR